MNQRHPSDVSSRPIAWYDCPASPAGTAFRQGIYVKDPKASEAYDWF